MKELDKTLLKLVEKVAAIPLSEESHPSWADDEPDFHTVHHQAFLTINNRPILDKSNGQHIANSVYGAPDVQHLIGEQMFKRNPGESSKEFDKRVSHHIYNSVYHVNQYAAEDWDPGEQNGVRDQTSATFGNVLEHWKEFGEGERDQWITYNHNMEDRHAFVDQHGNLKLNPIPHVSIDHMINVKS